MSICPNTTPRDDIYWPDPIQFNPGPGEAVIYLNRGFSVLVSEEDYDRLSKYTWTASVDRAKGRVYASRWARGDGGKRVKVYLHRDVVSAPPNTLVDHRDGCTLNATRGNLRVVSTHVNCHNSERGPRGVCEFRGVTMDRGMYRARIYWKGVEYRLGRFTTARAAAAAYDVKAVELMGEFAWVNFPADIPKVSASPVPFP